MTFLRGKQQSQKGNTELLIKQCNYSDVSFAAYTNGTIWIFVHLPLYSYSEEFTLFEYVEMPYISPGSSNGLAMRIHSDNTLLAVSKDDTRHQIYSTSEITKCTPVGTGHGRLLLCPNANVYYKSEHKDCITGLFKRDMEVIKEYCTWKMVNKEPYVLQRNSNQFLVYVPEPTELKVVCSDGSRSIEDRSEINGHTKVTVQGMCKAYCDRY